MKYNLSRDEVINLVRSLDYPTSELHCCGHYDWDGDYNWNPAGNACWKKYTTKELMDIYNKYKK